MILLVCRSQQTSSCNVHLNYIKRCRELSVSIYDWLILWFLILWKLFLYHTSSMFNNTLQVRTLHQVLWDMVPSQKFNEFVGKETINKVRNIFSGLSGRGVNFPIITLHSTVQVHRTVYVPWIREEANSATSYERLPSTSTQISSLQLPMSFLKCSLFGMKLLTSGACLQSRKASVKTASVKTASNVKLKIKEWLT